MRTPNHAATLDARSLAVLVPALCCALTVANVEARSPIFHPASSAHVTTAWAAPLAWTEQKVTASNGVAHDAFGQSIAIRGTTALIGAVDVNNWEGAIYVFTQTGGVWTEGQEFMADDGAPNDRATFGTAIMIDGDTAVIGALGATVNGHANQGAAYVFKEAGGIWSQVAKLVAEDGEANSYFGQTAAIAGSNIVVGAYGASVNGNALQGAAYVFTNVGGTWTFAHKLVADDGVGGEFFGHAVAMSGTRALVGAPYTAVDGTPARGAVYVYDGSSGDWSQVGKVVADAGNPGDGFGYSLAATTTHMVVGAGGSDGGQGAAFAFADDGGAWTQQGPCRRRRSDGRRLRLRRRDPRHDTDRRRRPRGRKRQHAARRRVRVRARRQHVDADAETHRKRRCDGRVLRRVRRAVRSIRADRRALCDRRRSRGAGRGIFL